MELFAFQNKLNAAPVSSYPDIQLPDCEGKQAKLSENVDKATLLIFWKADDAVHKMYNLEVLKPLYDKYAPYGFRIYSVNTGADKAVWAMSVKEQGLPWVNVCDTKGSSLAFYGVTEVPTLFLITDDSLERMEKISPDYLSAKVSSCLQ